MTQRDWQKDMDTWKAASEGPDLCVGDTEVWSEYVGSNGEGSWLARFDKTEDAMFYCEAHEALPYWLREAKKWRERYEQRPTFELLEAAQSLYEHHNARADEAEKQTKVYKQSYEGTLTAWEAEKARAGAAEARIKELENSTRFELIRHIRTEADRKEYLLAEEIIRLEEREQRLKEAISEALSWTWGYFEGNMLEVRAALSGVLSTLYPDTPAPTFKEEN